MLKTDIVTVIYPPAPDRGPLPPWEWAAAVVNLSRIFGGRWPSKN
ncbi:MAG: hypothetical protein NTY77_05515 [Elusimicrobia bacterium]|nr:hypothetical protein [Elusimicrobiota bacterium]